MELDIKVTLAPDAIMPEYQTDGASGMDLATPRNGVYVTLESGERARIGTGVSREIPEGYEGQVRPRSGMATNRGLVANFGTIDSDYRGEIGVTLVNISDKQQTICPGDRIAQLVIAPVARAQLIPVAELSQTERGGGGHGSTGTQ